ncbi:methyltransferase [Antarcticibacterium flavum]|uniref:tRNA1(Val) (adenine(37)-N6)-methyltransferase n=1 Tax=Antarcticibacterium flavum TaxID=2058175 RepID=A0A5B7X371_9FLAO|nr:MULTISPECIES: methyltransferase [Antarcticibacterium]MCM4159404.1 tRNA (adenine-N(6)-)-methyltransferase [Antarcticibacterium sp. W02-3]QCY69956.1 methyltransferase [Antarcticibacterium flavum]
MKIGTDGVLLGAWTRIDDSVASILDIGAGTGVIALMLAQRSYADLIDALEIDEDAYEQAVDNFENSPWGDRLFCYHAAFDEFVEEMQEEKYDLIVSNPPFFNSEAASAATNREIARFQEALPFEELLDGVSQLLSETGTFNVIIPRMEQDAFLKLAHTYKLFPRRITHVKGTPESPSKRSLMELGFSETEVEIEELIIETARHEYTAEYVELVKDFYLKM